VEHPVKQGKAKQWKALPPAGGLPLFFGLPKKNNQKIEGGMRIK